MEGARVLLPKVLNIREGVQKKLPTHAGVFFFHTRVGKHTHGLISPWANGGSDYRKFLPEIYDNIYDNSSRA